MRRVLVICLVLVVATAGVARAETPPDDAALLAELTQLRDEIDRLDALRAQPPGTPGREGADAAIVAARAALGAFERAHRIELAAIQRRRAQAREEGRARFEAGLTRTRAEAAMRALELRLGYHTTMQLVSPEEEHHAERVAYGMKLWTRMTRGLAAPDLTRFAGGARKLEELLRQVEGFAGPSFADDEHELLQAGWRADLEERGLGPDLPLEQRFTRLLARYELAIRLEARLRPEAGDPGLAARRVRMRVERLVRERDQIAGIAAAPDPAAELGGPAGLELAMHTWSERAGLVIGMAAGQARDGLAAALAMIEARLAHEERLRRAQSGLVRWLDIETDVAGRLAADQERLTRIDSSDDPIAEAGGPDAIDRLLEDVTLATLMPDPGRRQARLTRLGAGPDVEPAERLRVAGAWLEQAITAQRARLADSATAGTGSELESQRQLLDELVYDRERVGRLLDDPDPLTVLGDEETLDLFVAGAAGFASHVLRRDPDPPGAAALPAVIVPPPPDRGGAPGASLTPGAPAAESRGTDTTPEPPDGDVALLAAPADIAGVASAIAKLTGASPPAGVAGRTEPDVSGGLIIDGPGPGAATIGRPAGLGR